MRHAFLLTASVLLSVAPAVDAAGPDYQSKHLAVGLSRLAPAFSVFAVDSLGHGKLVQNPVLPETKAVAGLALDSGTYTLNGRPVWRVAWNDRTVTLRSEYVAGIEALPFVLAFNQRINHATLLGLMKPGERQMGLPCVLHLPDMGTLRITGTGTLDYDSQRKRESGLCARRVSAGDGRTAARRVPVRGHRDLSEAARHRTQRALRRVPARLAQYLPGQRTCRCLRTTRRAIRVRARCSSTPTSPPTRRRWPKG
jgi:hypothetical protein